MILAEHSGQCIFVRVDWWQKTQPDPLGIPHRDVCRLNVAPQVASGRSGREPAEVGGSGWKWVEVPGGGLKWVEVGRGGWKYLEVG